MATTPVITVTYPDGDKQKFKNQAEIADAYGQMREERLTADKVAKALKERESTLGEWLIQNLPKSSATGISGKLWNTSIVTSTQPVVNDWDAFNKFVLKHKAFDLYQRRLSPEAVKERWNNKVAIDGVGRIDIPKISLTKAKGAK